MPLKYPKNSAPSVEMLTMGSMSSVEHSVPKSVSADLAVQLPPIGENHKNEALAFYTCSMNAPYSDRPFFPQNEQRSDYKNTEPRLILGWNHPSDLALALWSSVVHRMEVSVSSI